MRFVDPDAPPPPSWSMRTSGTADEGGRLLTALFVRDCLALDVDPSWSAAPLPPPLRHEVPDRTSLLDAGDPSDDRGRTAREGAAREWAVWWSALVVVEDALDADRLPAGPASWTHPLLERGDDLRLDRPADDLLPVLRGRCGVLEREAVEWNRPRSSVPPGLDGPSFPWTLLREVAENPPWAGRGPRGAVVELPVRGMWWRATAAGTVLCSTEAARTPETVRRIVAEAFARGA